MSLFGEDRRGPIVVINVCGPGEGMMRCLDKAFFVDREPWYNGHPRSIRETRRAQKRSRR